MIKEMTKYSIVCDRCGKEYSYYGDTEFSDFEEARECAHNDGWRMTNTGKDLCDVCVEYIKGEEK